MFVCIEFESVINKILGGGGSNILLKAMKNLRHLSIIRCNQIPYRGWSLQSRYNVLNREDRNSNESEIPQVELFKYLNRISSIIRERWKS